MSVSSISTQAAERVAHKPSLQQLLSSQLSRLDDSTDQTAVASGITTAATSQDGSSGANGISGPSTTQLSDGILNVLFGMQQQATATNAGSSTTSLKDFLAAMDTDGDSQISQSEFEGYLTKNGATKEQADKIFSSVDSDGSGEISSSELSQAIENGRPHGRPHGPGGPPRPEDIAKRIFESIDTDGDGTVSKTDLESFMTAKGGTADQADKDFAALDINGDGSLTQDEVAQKLAAALPQPGDAASTTSADSSQTVKDSQSSAWSRLLDALSTASSSSSTTNNTPKVALAA